MWAAVPVTAQQPLSPAETCAEATVRVPFTRLTGIRRQLCIRAIRPPDYRGQASLIQSDVSGTATSESFTLAFHGGPPAELPRRINASNNMDSRE